MQANLTYIQHSWLFSYLSLCCIDAMSTLLYAVVRSRGKEVLESLKILKEYDSEDEDDNVKQSGTPDSNSDIYLSASTLSRIIVFFPILYVAKPLEVP